MAPVCCFLLSVVLFFHGNAEVTRLRDWTPGQEFHRCLKAFDWARVTQDDEVAILDRDAETGCCTSGWLPGQQPLVRFQQTLIGTYPVLYLYGQITCGWRNGTFGKVGSKPASVGAKCDYGTCYILPSNFTCGDGRPPFLNGCCSHGNYGSACKRGYYFEDGQSPGKPVSSSVEQDDLTMHLQCKPGTGPGWGGKHCEIDYTPETCYTRSRRDWLGPSDFGGTLTTDDDVIQGYLQPDNVYGVRWCPPTTTSTTQHPNATYTTTTLEVIPPNFTDINLTRNDTLPTFELNATPTKTPYVNTSTTTTTVTTTTNTSTTTTTYKSTTTSTSTWGPAGYVVGHLVLSVDSPVIFVSHDITRTATHELIAVIAGKYVTPSMVNYSMIARTTNKYEDSFAGARRLLGLVDVNFEIKVPLRLTDYIVSQFDLMEQLVGVSKHLYDRIMAKGIPELARSVYVQEIYAVALSDTTTVTSTYTHTGCPDGDICIRQTCGGCEELEAHEGLKCQERQTDEGDCTCSCFQPGNITTTGASKGLASHSVQIGGLMSCLLAAMSFTILW